MPETRPQDEFDREKGLLFLFKGGPSHGGMFDAHQRGWHHA